jgi:hypothetical protein
MKAVIVYDNMNFESTVQDEHLGHTSKMETMTTAAIVLCPELPDKGLTQDMHDPSVQLSIDDILTNLCIDDTYIEIQRGCIIQAINRIHPGAVLAVFKDRSLIPDIPIIEEIPINTTQYHQLGAIYENEGTIDGTYSVHDNIFLEQLGLNAPEEPSLPTVPLDSPKDFKPQARRSSRLESLSQKPPVLSTLTSSTPNRADDFATRLWLVFGDQLSSQLNRSVKCEQRYSSRAYDQRKWLLPVPSWFHIHMNYLFTIVRTHWMPAEDDLPCTSQHTLQDDMLEWHRSGFSKEYPLFHILEPLVAQCYTSRVTALFYASMAKRGFLVDCDPSKLDDPSTLESIICSLTPSQFDEIVTDVRHSAFDLAAWDGEGHEDIEFRTMCRMVQEIELAIVIQHALKRGDIGLLRRCVEPLIVFFAGTGQHNYADEMIYYRWLLHDKVSTPELQHAILAGGLVNWKGNRTGHKAIDLSLEHLNLAAKIELNCYKDSTPKDVELIFDQVCLTNTYIQDLRSRIESTFRAFIPGTHSTKTEVRDMQELAIRLFIQKQAKPRTTEELAKPQLKPFSSIDVLLLGMEDVPDRISAFNTKYTLMPRCQRENLYSMNTTPNLSTQDSGDRSVDTGDDDNSSVLPDEITTAYVSYIGEIDNLDSIIDPTIDLSMIDDDSLFN